LPPFFHAAIDAMLCQPLTCYADADYAIAADAAATTLMPCHYAMPHCYDIDDADACCR